MRTIKLAAVLAVPVLALAACGGSSDEDQITDIIVEGGKDPVAICDHLSDDLMETFGSLEACQESARQSADEDPDVEVRSVEIDGDTATAKINGSEGDQTVTFTKDGDDWKVTESQ